jgi:hypothetical protein
MVVLIYWSQEACLWVTDKRIDAEFLLVTVIEDLHFLKDQIKCCRRDRLQYQPSSGAPQPSGLHPNDILVNIKLSPSTYPGMVVGGSSTWKLGSSSMYDLLQELQSLTNAHRKDCQLFTLYLLCFGWLWKPLTTFQWWGTGLADYAQYTLHLLHSSFPMYFGAEFRGSKLKKSPEYQVCLMRWSYCVKIEKSICIT